MSMNMKGRLFQLIAGDRIHSGIEGIHNSLALGILAPSKEEVEQYSKNKRRSYDDTYQRNAPPASRTLSLLFKTLLFLSTLLAPLVFRSMVNWLLT